MKKLSMILSAMIAGTMLIPVSANAANQYPPHPEFIKSAQEVLSEEEYESYRAEWASYFEALNAGYRAGEYDWDFNLDGELTVVDMSYVLSHYAGEVVGRRSYTWTDNYSFQGVQYAKVYDFTEEMHEKIEENGDVDGNGVVTANDCSIMMNLYYTNMERGDVNTDGYVDARDASELLAYYSAQSVGDTADYVTETNMEYLGDVNGDGAINASDASAILKAYSSNAVAE